MQNKKLKVAVFTGNRAEFGLQLPILREIKKNKKMDYYLVVSGAHLDSDFGNTLKEIKKKGFVIHKKVKINMDAKNLKSNVTAIGSGVLSISKAFIELKPDIVLVYADRFEGFAAVIASTQLNIPTAHIEGGDITEGGALDDSVRHAMTKLSHLHFTTNEQATNRILAMGEERWRVHTVGFPALDLIKKRSFATINEIKEKFKFDFSNPIILFTQHSVTTRYKETKNQIKESIKALQKLSSLNYNIIITYPNNDAGGSIILDQYNKLIKKKNTNIFIFKSLGQYYYHGILSLAKYKSYKVICVGNSSSGIKETPIFNCPTINIGTRQDGRLRGDNVLDVDYKSIEIIKAIKYSLNNQKFIKKCGNTRNPYYIGNAGKKIVKILLKIKINQKLITKKMQNKGLVRNGWYK